MFEPEIRRATPGDRPSVVELLHAEGLLSEGVDPALAGFVVAEEGGERVVGAAGLERYEAFGLLRSVVVASDRRGLGLGRRLTEAVVAEARLLGLDGVYALTTTAADYFPRLGFTVIGREALPDPVRGSDEFRTMCSTSAIVLGLVLRAPAPGGANED